MKRELPRLPDGRGGWDTILAAQALAQAGETSNPFVLAAERLYETQTAEGGYPYGRDFEQYPDVDDTSRALLFWTCHAGILNVEYPVFLPR